MLHVLRRPIAKQCERFDCPAYHKRVGVHEVFCPQCDQALASVDEIDRRLVLLIGGVGLVLLAGTVFVVHTVAARRAARQEAELLDRAGDLFQRSLAGATRTDVDARADAIQQQHHLTPEQRRQMIEGASGVIARLPQSLSLELRRRMEELLREIYRDGRVSMEDRERLDAFVSEQRIIPQEARSFERSVSGRIEISQQSLGRGNAFIRQRQYAEAHAEYLKATEADPEDPVAWANLGASHMLLGRPADAAVCYDRALRIDAHNWLAHYNRGLLAARTGDPESAFQHFEQALSWVPPEADRERGAMIRDLLEEPSLTDLRKDPRFAEILNRRDAPAEAPANQRSAS